MKHIKKESKKEKQIKVKDDLNEQIKSGVSGKDLIAYYSGKYGEEAMEKLEEELNKNKPKTTFGAAASYILSSFTAAAEAISATDNAVKILSDDSTTLGQKFGAVGYAMGSLGTTVGAVYKNINEFKDEIDGIGMSVGGLTALTAGLAVLGYAGINIGLAAHQNYSTQGKLETANNLLATQQQTVAEKQSNKEQLQVILEEYNKSVLDLNNKIYGSSDYYTQQANLNTIAGNLIDTYSLINGKDYSIRNGSFFIDKASQARIAEQAEKEYLQAVNQESILQQTRNYYAAQRQLEIRSEELGLSGFGIYENKQGVYYSTPSNYSDTQLFTAEQAKKIREEDNAYQIALDKRTSALKSLGELTLEDIAQNQEITLNDLTRAAFVNQEDLEEKLVKVLDTINNATIDNIWGDIASVLSFKGMTGYEGANTNKELWEMLKERGYVTGEIPEEESALRAALEGAMPSLLMEQQVLDYINGIDNTIQEQFGDFKNLRISQIEERTKKYLGSNENASYRKAIEQEVENIQVGLLNAMVENFSPEFIQQTGRLTKGQGGALDRFAELYTLNEQQWISDYLISAGSVFGSGTSQLLFEKLSKDRNVATLEQLSKINWDNTFSALDDLNKLAKNLSGESNIYSEVLQSAIDVMGGEGGLFKKLYDSSGFQDVLASLTEQFDLMGTVTTEAVTKLSAKSEELNAILGLSGSSFAQLGLNAAGIAKLLTQINKGTITAGQVTTDLVRSLSVAGDLEAEKYRAFDVVDNQSYGRSGTDLLDYFTNAQNYYLAAKQQNLTYDAPLRGIFDHMMPGSVKTAYYQAIQSGNGKSFDEIIKMLPQNVQDFLNKSNKKGTKGTATWEDIIDLYAEFFQEMFDENQTIADFLMSGAGGGISFKDGDIHLFSDKTGQFKLTTEDLKTRLTEAFRAMNMSDEDAENMASMWIGYIANTSAGALVEEQDADAALKEFISRPGQKNAIGEFTGHRLVNTNELLTLFNTYGAQLGYSDYKTFEKEVLDQMPGAYLTPSAYDLRNQVWNQGINTGSLAKLGDLYGAANENLKLDGIDAFKSLMETFGVYTKEGTVDFDKFKDLIAFLGGTEESAIDLLKNTNTDELGKISTKITDLFGNISTITQAENETYEHYQKRVTQAQNEASNEWYWDPEANNGQGDYVFDPLGYKREQASTHVAVTSNYGQNISLPQAIEEYRNLQQQKEEQKKNNEEPVYDDEAATQAAKALSTSRYKLQSILTNAGISLSQEDWESITQGNGPNLDLSSKQFILPNGNVIDIANMPWEFIDKLQSAFDDYIDINSQYNKIRDDYTKQKEQYEKDKEKFDEQFYVTNKDTILNAAQQYVSRIDTRMLKDGVVTGNEAVLSALYQEYLNSDNDEKKQALLLKKMDVIMSNTGIIADQNGELIDLTADENGMKKLTAETDENGNTIFTDEKGNKFTMPSAEEVQAQYDMGYGGGDTNTPTVIDLLQQLVDNTGGGKGPAKESIRLNEGNTGKNTGTSNNGTYGKIDMSLVKVASGQNNQTLAFASGNKGQIAVTGELGPELRIKEDGTADLLGKKGREYTWVEPGDRIYTAFQTASILGNNNIPALEGLAKGIQNYIPGYYTSAIDYSVDTRFQAPSGQTQVGSTDNKGSSGGGDSGGGGEPEWVDPRYDPNTLKIRDVVERYYPYIQQLQFIAKDLEHISTVVDRSWGKDHLKAVQEQTKILEKQAAKQQEKIAADRNYLANDKDALVTMAAEVFSEFGSTFDMNAEGTVNEGANKFSVDFWKDQIQSDSALFGEYGELLNYDELVTKLVQLYNANAEENAGDKQVQYTLQERLKDIQFYNETLMTLREDEEALFNTQNQIFDNRLKEVVDELELANELNNNQLAMINYNISRYKDDTYEIARYIALLADKNDILSKELNDEREAIFKLLSKNINQDIDSNMQNEFLQNPAGFFDTYFRDKTDDGVTQLTKDEVQTLEGMRDTMLDLMLQIENNQKEIINTIGDTIKTLSKSVSRAVDKFDYFADIEGSVENILDLTNRRMTNIDSTLIRYMKHSELNNAINKMKGSKTAMDAAQHMFDSATNMYNNAVAEYNAARNEAIANPSEKATAAVDDARRKMQEFKKQMETAEDNLENAVKGWYGSWEEALKAAQELYKSAVEEAARTFEESFSPFYTTLELLEQAFNRQKKLTKLYEEDYQRIYSLSKLNRDITQSIIDTDNLKSKARLRDLQQEINDLQSSGVALSEYDLDILDKKYKLELARQELEDAKDAKSLVRLSRDNNGNWGYVYTANEEDVADAEQHYEDAIRDMEQANEDYINNIEDQILQVQREAQQAIAALNPSDFGSYEAYVAQVMEIYNAAKKTQDYLASQADNVFANQNYLDPYIINRYGTNNHNLTDQFSDLTISKILGLNSMNGVTNGMVGRFEDYINTMTYSFKEYMEFQDLIWKVAGSSLADAGTKVKEIFDDMNKQSDTQLGKVWNEALQATVSFDEMMEEVENSVGDYSSQLDEIISLLTSLNGFLADAAKGSKSEEGTEGEESNEANQTLEQLQQTTAENTQLAAEAAQTAAEGAQIAGEGTQNAAESAQSVVESAQTLADNSQATAEAAQSAAEGAQTAGEGAQNAAESASLAAQAAAQAASSAAEAANSAASAASNAASAAERAATSTESVAKSASNINTTLQGMVNNNTSTSGEVLLSGGYTGRWSSALSGMYTGEWPEGSVERNGRLAFLHQKELVLNAHDTENFLDAMEIVRELDNLTNWMANGLGSLLMPQISSANDILEQNVHIDASFPNVSNHQEIEDAFNNLVNMASQYAYRK